MDECMHRLEQILQQQPTRLVLSAPRKGQPLVKAAATRVGTGWQLETRTATQAFHENMQQDAQLVPRLAELLAQAFTQLNAHGPKGEASLRITKKGKILSNMRAAASTAPLPVTAHNREKHRLLPEGTCIAPLIDMGVFTASGQVVASMQDKYRQINRFVELVDDALRPNPPQSMTILDFGCGKSYLTFILYYYLTEVKGIQVSMTGLDLKADVVENCNKAARKYGYSGLRFALGDIAGWQHTGPLDMVVTLHACNTATDYALAHAVQWGVGMVFSVPCCQHELNAQMQSEELALLTRYGIVKERTAALLTDALRANLLEVCGYKTQLLEFVDFAHTPKNILIRAVRTPRPAAVQQQALAEVHNAMAAFHVKPTLYTLLQQQGRLPEPPVKE